MYITLFASFWVYPILDMPENFKFHNNYVKIYLSEISNSFWNKDVKFTTHLNVNIPMSILTCNW